MCGRYTLRSPLAEVARAVDAAYAQAVLSFSPRFNIAPTQQVPVVRLGDGRELSLMRWGLIPAWAKDVKIGNSAINARSEGIDAKPMFRSAFKRRRCLVMADGFYEWRGPRPGEEHVGKPSKTPYFIHLKSDDVFTFGGLWEVWRGPDGIVESCTIITTTPNALMAQLHDRMPVIVPPAARNEWMAESTPTGRLHELMSPFPADEMDAYAVGKAVGNPRNESPDVILPVPESN